MRDASPFWTPGRHADRRPFLLGRDRIVKAIRAYFEDGGFLEIEPALLQVSPGNEVHLHAFATELMGTDGARQRLFLHTSPEFACKKLIAAGEERLFTLTHVFRNRERGGLHHPEFTMLEWYRAREPYERLMSDCSALLAAAANAAGTRTLTYRGRTADPFAEPERLAVADAVQSFTGVDLLASLQGAIPDRNALAISALSAGIRVGEDDTWSDIFSRIIVEIEPRLGIGRPVILDRYPICEAALACPCASDPRTAERFELYCCGIELANGFGELTDPVEQRRRFLNVMDEKERIYGERYPIDEDFLRALAIMPPASGIALGLDRLVMLATGAPRIEQVIWTPVAGT